MYKTFGCFYPQDFNLLCDENWTDFVFLQLVKSNWAVSVTLASSNETTNTKIPRAAIHLHAKDPVSNENEVNVLDFTEEELVKFYEVVEHIQEKLDEICTKTEKWCLLKYYEDFNFLRNLLKLFNSNFYFSLLL